MPGTKSIRSPALKLERHNRGGRSFVVVLALIVLVAGFAFAWWRADRTSNDRGELLLPAPNAAVNEDSTALTQPPAGSQPMAPEPGGLEIGRSSTLPRPEPVPFDDSRLEGRGRIRGFVQAPPGIEFPQEWVLDVKPSASLIGREKAETRKLEFHAGEQHFDLENLALGGYMLRASAFGLATEEQHLLLAKPHETEVYVQMQLVVTAFVEGSVRFADYTPAIGLELSLEPKPAGARNIAITDSVGHFVFSDVKSGSYTLHFGPPENPVRESIDVDVSDSPRRLPDAFVPKMSELIVRVFSSPGAPAAGVKLDGYGDKGGRITAQTNADGEYRARFLPPGRITVTAVFSDGRSVMGRKIVAEGGLEVLELVLDK